MKLIAQISMARHLTTNTYIYCIMDGLKFVLECQRFINIHHKSEHEIVAGKIA